MMFDQVTRQLAKNLLIIFLYLFLSGCLFSKDPILDDSNSISAQESSELERFLEIAENYRWFHDEDVQKVPVPYFSLYFPENVTSEVRVGPSLNGILLLQEDLGNCSMPFCIAYYGVRVRSDGTPEFCLIETQGIAELKLEASDYGVTLKVIENHDTKVGGLPPDIGIIGDKENIRQFVFSRFELGKVHCDDPPLFDDPSLFDD